MTPEPASQVTEAPPESASQVPEQTTPQPASQETGSSEATPTEPAAPSAPKVPEKSAREKLISKLIGEEDVTPTTDDEPTPPEAIAPTDKGTTPKPGDTPNSPKRTEAPAHDDDAEPDLTEVTNESVKAMKPGEARRHINKLVKKVKDSEALASGFKEIIDVCEQNNFTPADYKAWVDIGIGVQNGDPESIKNFAELAVKLGVSAPAATAAAITPEIDTWLNKQVEDLEISAASAAELRKRLTKPAAPVAPPAVPPVQRQAPAAPVHDQVDPSKKRASDSMNRIADEYEKKIGTARFAELEPRIKAALSKRKGTHPDAWPDIFRATIEAEIAKAPKTASVVPSLRPGASSTPASPQSFSTERSRVIHKYTT